MTAKSKPPTSRGPIRRVVSVAIYCGYLVACLLVIDYFAFYRPFRERVRFTNPPRVDQLDTRYLDREVLEQVGWLQEPKVSSFVHASREPAAGTVRLCALGDSFTHGAETDDDGDYPGLLQARARALGYPVEALNFGVGWWGFHQSYLMWDRVARHYGCTYVLLGPKTFYPERDTSFNHPFPEAPYALHARYVLEGDGVRLVEVDGGTHQERFDAYFRFVPRLRYLRYDRHAPAFLQALVLDDDTLPNPFYYRRDSAREEAFATYRILLGRLADEGVQVLLTHYEEIESFTGLEGDNLVAFEPQRPLTFPYLAPRGHNSAWGNDLLARQLLARLVGEQPVGLPRLVTASLPTPPPRLAHSYPLAEYDRIRIELDDTTIGHFAVMDLFGPPSSPAALRGRGVVSLLGFHAPGDSVLDAAWVPLASELRSGAQVHLRAGDLDASLGRVRLLAAGSNLGFVEVEGVELGPHQELRFGGSATIPLARLRSQRPIAVELDGETILKGTPIGASIELAAPGQFLWRLRAALGGFVDPDHLPGSGHLDLVLEHAEAGLQRLPIASWAKTTVAQAVPTTLAPLPRADRRGPGPPSAGAASAMASRLPDEEGTDDEEDQGP